MGPPIALGPPVMAFAAAFFWALVGSPPANAAAELLDVLTLSDAALPIATAAPPWLPFLAFVALLSAPLGTNDGEWVWANSSLRPKLHAFAALHLVEKDPSAWLVNLGDWLSEALRGLCDRLAKTFTEESFGDALLASTLWAFAAPLMPSECRAVCWGMQDPAVLVLLSRTLPMSPRSEHKENVLNELDGDVDESSDSKTKGMLLWPLSAYLGPPREEFKVVQHAVETLGIDKFQDTKPYVADVSWPAILAMHHHAQHHGKLSPLLENDRRKDRDSTMGSVGSLNELE